MKRILAFIMILVVALALCACGGGKTCPSCGRSVDSLQTKQDWAGDTHSWCSKCWSEYWDIIGG